MLGKIYQYLHHNNSVGSMIELRTQTDFALRSECVNTLAKEICLQVASLKYIGSVDELLTSRFVKDDTKSIADLIDKVKEDIGEDLILTKVSVFDSNTHFDPYSTKK